MSAQFQQSSVNIRDLGRVAVLFGGDSPEREISLKSGNAVLRALLSSGVDAHGVDWHQGALLDLKAGNYDRVFIALHGPGGEDGTLQGALESVGLPYSGSGVLGSALAMDKLRTKWVWQGLGLPTPQFVSVDSPEALQQAQQLPFPVIVKPVSQGSSIGMTKVDSPSDLKAACDVARKVDDHVLIEQWIKGAEYTASILGGQALPLIRLETPRTFYDYEAKYFANDTRYHCPCGLDPAIELRFRDMALKAFAAVDCSGWGRVDFMCDAQGNPWLLEVNTIPGMTDHSLVPMAARAAGVSFEQLCLEILAQSLTAKRGQQ